MGGEEPTVSEFHTPEEVNEVRQDLASTWLETLGVLRKELTSHKNARGKKTALPEAFVKKLKICSDQLRIEYRIGRPVVEETSEAGESASQPKDPMDGFAVVSDEDAA